MIEYTGTASTVATDSLNLSCFFESKLLSVSFTIVTSNLMEAGAGVGAGVGAIVGEAVGGPDGGGVG